MFYNVWLGIHIIGVVIAVFLLYRITQEDFSEYKSDLQLMSACSLLMLVARTMYIMSGPTMAEILAIKKLEYLGKGFAIYYGLMFILKFRGIKWPQIVTKALLFTQIVIYAFVITAGRQKLFYTSYRVVREKTGYELINGHGPLHVIFIALQFIEVLFYVFYCSEPILRGQFKKLSAPIRAVQLSLTVSAVAPLTFMIITNFKLFGHTDTTAIGALISNLFLYIAIYKQGLFDVVRMAKDTVLENVGEGIVITDAKYGLLYANEAAKNLFPQMKFSVGSENTKYLQKMMEKTSDIYETSDKKYRIRVHELKKNKNMNAYAATIVDVTDELTQAERMRELKDKAEKANEAKSFFLSNMSHEIRTPMNAIVGMTEIMLRTNLDEATRGYLLNIQSSGRALIGIINDVLDFSKIESGKMEIISKEFSLSDRLDEIGLMFLTRIGEKDIRLIYDIDPDMPSVLYGDVLRLRQVVINIVNNAIKFTDSGFVKLSLRMLSMDEEKSDMYIAVEDTGQGISEEGIERLFHSFEQVDSKRNYEKEGTGLGLAISKQLIELMGGNLQVESTYGVGSKFYCTVQLGIKDPTPAAKINLPDSEQRSIVISSYLNDEQETELLEELCEHFELEYVSYSDMVRQRRKVTQFFLAYEQYREVGSEVRALIGEDAELIVIFNPVTDMIEDDAVTRMARPLYASSFCRILNHETVSQNIEVQEFINFTASNAHVLIVDDNKMNLKVAAGLLEPLKMTIDVADSGKKAIEMIKTMAYDLVFMDHMMPVMDGIETTQYIRSLDDEYFKELPIIALSANAVTGARELFLENGMSDFVAKPIDLKEICEKIRYWLPSDYIETCNTSVIDEKQEDLSEFEGIEGIDAKEGVKNSGSKELFASLLADFYRLIDMKANKIEKCLDDGLLKDYTIEVHALKNTARMIGAIELSESFRHLEELGNEKDERTLFRDTPAVLSHFRMYKQFLKEYASMDENNKQETDTAHLTQLLAQIGSRMNDFDLDGVDEAMNELECYKMPEGCSDKMDELRAYVADVAMEDVIRVAGELIDILS